MLDPTRISLDAATVGFRTRMRQAVDWGSFNQALQTQSESIKVRRELEETPVSEVHVMGGQQFGIAGNQKTNELARQQRQMNGYPLRSFLVTGGPVVLPTKREEGLLAIPINRGLAQYTQYNGVVGNYASSFTEPLTAPMASEMQMLARAGAQAKSDSIVNPYKALQFQLNMHKTQAEIADNEARHKELRGYNQEGLLKASMDAENAGLSGKKLKRKILSTGAVASVKPTPQQLLLGRVRLTPTVPNPVGRAARQLMDENILIPEETNGEEEFMGESDYPGDGESKMAENGDIIYPTPRSSFGENLNQDEEDFIKQSAIMYDLDKYQAKEIFLKYGRDVQRTLNELRDIQRQLYENTVSSETVIQSMTESQKEALTSSMAGEFERPKNFLKAIEEEREALKLADMVSNDFNASDPLDAAIGRTIAKVARINEEAATRNRGGLVLDMGSNESRASAPQAMTLGTPQQFGGNGTSDGSSLAHQLFPFTPPSEIKTVRSRGPQPSAEDLRRMMAAMPDTKTPPKRRSKQNKEAKGTKTYFSS